MKKGFTLIELLVVIGIIGILSGLIAVGMSKAIDSANDAKRRNNIDTIRRGLMIYGSLHGGTFPIQPTQCDIGSSCPNVTSALLELLPVLPTDPDGIAYRYLSYDGSNFTVSTTLSNGKLAVGPIDGLQCRNNWIDSGQGFCIMKYEAKNVGGVATSAPADRPWASITQASAVAACASLGNGSHLITNAEWTILARDIETVPSNWNSTRIYTGNSDLSPNDTLPVLNPSDPYDQTQNISPSMQRRTFNLSNGNVIWDLSGNIAEWTSDVCRIGTGQGLWQGTGEIEWNDSSLADYEKQAAGPIGNFTTINGIGNYIGCNHDNYAFNRGGRWGGPHMAGLFDVDLSYWSTYSGGAVGFRCTSVLP